MYFKSNYLIKSSLFVFNRLDFRLNPFNCLLASLLPISDHKHKSQEQKSLEQVACGTAEHEAIDSKFEVEGQHTTHGDRYSVGDCDANPRSLFLHAECSDCSLQYTLISIKDVLDSDDWHRSVENCQHVWLRSEDTEDCFFVDDQHEEQNDTIDPGYE